MKFSADHKGGRPKGAKNRLQKKFLEDLVKDWETHGAAAIKIMRVEDPSAYVRTVAALLPREIDVDTRLIDFRDWLAWVAAPEIKDAMTLQLGPEPKLTLPPSKAEQPAPRGPVHVAFNASEHSDLAVEKPRLQLARKPEKF